MEEQGTQHELGSRRATAWTLRYASHLGYRSADAPLFPHSVGSLDPVAHVDFAADLGFSGVQYALARSRPVAEQEAVARALSRHNLETGCVIYTTRDKLISPLWSVTGVEARAALEPELRAAFETAKRVNSRYLAVLSGANPCQPLVYQRAAMTENLRWAATLAERAGLILCVELVNRRNLANMLLHHVGDAYEVVKAVANPAVRLIFDTAHVQAMDGDLLAHLAACWDSIALVQIADHPGRLEPGSGEVNFATILHFLYRRNFRGLVELEHNWSEASRNAEARGIDYLNRIDAKLRVVAASKPA